MEPFKYQCTDFTCHYKNHITVVLISNKKLFQLYGYYVNNWGAFAPKLKYVEENIEYIPEENFFDTFNKHLKKIQQVTTYDKSFVRNIFKKESDNCSSIINTNLFFKYSPYDDDPISEQSEKDVKEVFQQFNEIAEI